MMMTRTHRLLRSGMWPLLLLLPGPGRVVLVMTAAAAATPVVTWSVKKWVTKVVVTVAGAVPRLYRRMGRCFEVVMLMMMGG